MKKLIRIGTAVCAFALAAPLFAQEESAEAADTGPKNIRIPASRIAARYVIGRLSNKELLDAPRVEFVFEAILARKGMNEKDRGAALDEIAALHKTDRMAELLAALERNDANAADAGGGNADLGKILSKSKPDEIAAKKTGFDALIEKAKQPETREAAYVGLIVADGKADAVWEKAAKDNDQLRAIVGAVPLVADAKLRAQFQPKIAPLAKQAPTPEIQKQAIAALPSLRGSESENFAILADLINAGTERDAAAAAMLRLPQASWPKDQAAPVARSIVDFATKVPPAKRTEKEFLEIVKLGNELASLLPADDAKAVRKSLGSLTVRVIALKTVHEQMLYDKARLVVETGKPVEIDFENPDSMPHNFVVTAPGAHEEIGKLAEKLQPTPDSQGRAFIPQTPKVLFATKLVEAGQKAKLSFTAPKEPGEYEYVCTFPGHYMRMWGKLIVTDDVEDYIAKNPEQEIKMTEWKLADFSDADFAKLASTNAGAGKPFFSALGCVACHKVGDEGVVFGPELTDVFAKWKNDPKAVLEQILEPSKAIDDAFRSWTLELASGDTVAGFIKGEKGGIVSVVAAPGAPPTEIKAADIKSRTKGEVSAMPPGLMNMLTKEQILDLLAYLKSGGKVEAHKH